VIVDTALGPKQCVRKKETLHPPTLNEWAAPNTTLFDSPPTHLQWRLRALGSGSAGPGRRCARSGRRWRKCSGGPTRTDGSLLGWRPSWTKQTASPPSPVGQPGPKQSPNRTGRLLSSRTIRIRTGTGWTGAPGRELAPGPCLEWAWLAETAARYWTPGRSTENSSWVFVFLEGGVGKRGGATTLCSFFSEEGWEGCYIYIIFYKHGNTNMQTTVCDSSDANKRSPRELMVKNDRRGSINSSSPKATKRDSCSYHFNLTVIHFFLLLLLLPVIGQICPGWAPLRILFWLYRLTNPQCRTTPFWGCPAAARSNRGFFGEGGRGLFLRRRAQCREGDNGAFGTGALVRCAVNAFVFCAAENEIAFSPLWSKWSLPSASSSSSSASPDA